MDENQFWFVISEACQSDPQVADEWGKKIQAVLMQYDPAAIIEWNHIFDRLAARAYTTDLVSACCLINLGAGDDGFYYFRCWLIGMGRIVYEAAVAHADTLADVVYPHIEAEAEIYAAAHQAWMAVTGKSDMEDYPARNEHAELWGEDWDIDDEEEVRRRLPRLAAIYLN